MATILPHPTLLQSATKIEQFQRRYSLLIVLGNAGPIAIPAIHMRPSVAQHSGYTGPEAA